MKSKMDYLKQENRETEAHEDSCSQLSPWQVSQVYNQHQQDSYHHYGSWESPAIGYNHILCSTNISKLSARTLNIVLLEHVVSLR